MTTLLPLGLAGALALITALAIITGQRNSNLLLVITAGWLVAFTAFGIAVFNRRRLTKAVDAVKGVAPIVSPGVVDAPPLGLASLLDEVRRLGFHLAGATDTTFGGRTIRTWVLVETSGEAWVEAGVASGPLLVFVSEDARGRFIETGYPKGEPIDDPRLLSQLVDSSASDALASHRSAARAAGGTVRIVKTMDDYLEAEADQRERTGGMRIQAYLDRVIRPAVRYWGIAALVALVCMTLVLFLPLRNA